MMFALNFDTNCPNREFPKTVHIPPHNSSEERNKNYFRNQKELQV
jgi:hypothetical protein